MTRPVIDRNTLAKRLTEVRASRDKHRKRVSYLERRLKHIRTLADVLEVLAVDTDNGSLAFAARKLRGALG